MERTAAVFCSQQTAAQQRHSGHYDLCHDAFFPDQNDGFDHVRDEFSSVLLQQVMKGNNALQRSKYITFSVEAESVRAAKMRLEQIELQLLNHLKRLGVQAAPLDGKERLQLMHGMLHMDDPQAPFLFDWKWLTPTGLSTKDFIAPSSFNFNDSYRFMIGRKVVSVSFVLLNRIGLLDENEAA